MELPSGLHGNSWGRQFLKNVGETQKSLRELELELCRILIIDVRPPIQQTLISPRESFVPLTGGSWWPQPSTDFPSLSELVESSADLKLKIRKLFVSPRRFSPGICRLGRIYDGRRGSHVKNESIVSNSEVPCPGHLLQPITPSDSSAYWSDSSTRTAPSREVRSSLWSSLPGHDVELNRWKCLRATISKKTYLCWLGGRCHSSGFSIFLTTRWITFHFFFTKKSLL